MAGVCPALTDGLRTRGRGQVKKVKRNACPLCPASRVERLVVLGPLLQGIAIAPTRPILGIDPFLILLLVFLDFLQGVRLVAKRIVLTRFAPFKADDPDGSYRRVYVIGHHVHRKQEVGSPRFRCKPQADFPEFCFHAVLCEHDVLLRRCFAVRKSEQQSNGFLCWSPGVDGSAR